MKIYLAIFLIATSFLFIQCEPDDSEPAIEVNFKAYFGSEDFEMDKAYMDPRGNSLRYTTFKFYISDLVLIKDDNSRIEISDIELVDFENSSTFTVDAEIDEGTYKAVEFGLGVSPGLNQQDPSVFPNDHPLSVYANTYWTWASRYRFALIEGDVDTSGNNTFPAGFVYHTGLDTLYRVKNIPVSIMVLDEVETINLVVQTEDIFFAPNKEIDYITESISHTTNGFILAERVTENLYGAIY